MNMYEFNEHVKDGRTYMQHFAGATTKDLNHYCELTLHEEKPDRCIINVGTNDIARKENATICKEITEIVKKCHDFGVNEVFVSGIPYRPQYQVQVRKVNDILSRNEDQHGYSFIDNKNIAYKHIWRDKIHLNDMGTDLLASNFLRALNDTRRI